MRARSPLSETAEPYVHTSDRKLGQPVRLLLSTLVLLVFPFGVRFRIFCGPWYRRPKRPSARKRRGDEAGAHGRRLGPSRAELWAFA